MVEKILGKWKSESAENFDEFMKAIGVNEVERKMGVNAETKYKFSRIEDHWVLEYSVSVKSGKTKFKIDETFDKTTPDGRKTKNLFTIDGDTLKEVQQCKKYCVTVIRSVSSDDKLSETYTVVDLRNIEKPKVISTKTYRRIAT